MELLQEPAGRAERRVRRLGDIPRAGGPALRFFPSPFPGAARQGSGRRPSPVRPGWETGPAGRGPQRAGERGPAPPRPAAGRCRSRRREPQPVGAAPRGRGGGRAQGPAEPRERWGRAGESEARRGRCLPSPEKAAAVSWQRGQRGGSAGAQHRPPPVRERGTKTKPR